MTDHHLTLEGVTKTYANGVTALRDVSLNVARSEVVVIVGPSGCGKSTLLRTINGLETIDSGTVTFDGKALEYTPSGLRQMRERVGMVFQNYELFPHLSVEDNLLLAPRLVKHEPNEVSRERARRLLDRVGLLNRASALPRQLSGGQKQRAAIVRALMMEPEVVLLDEVTASLDPEMVREVLDVVLELARDGMTLVLVTHEMDFARAIADRIVFMDAGQIVEISEPDQFFTNPTSERAKTFLQIFNFDEVDHQEQSSR